MILYYFWLWRCAAKIQYELPLRYAVHLSGMLHLKPGPVIMPLAQRSRNSLQRLRSPPQQPISGLQRLGNSLQQFPPYWKNLLAEAMNLVPSNRTNRRACPHRMENYRCCQGYCGGFQRHHALRDRSVGTVACCFYYIGSHPRRL